MAKKSAETLQSNFDRVAEGVKYGQPLDAKTQDWLLRQPMEIKIKLEKPRLLRASVSIPNSIGGFTSWYIDHYKPKKESRRKLENTASKLVSHMGGETLLSEVTPGMAERFFTWMKEDEKLSDSQANRAIGYAKQFFRRTCGIAKQFFEDAIDRRLISQNPFKHRDIPTATGGGDKSREFFVTRELATRVLQALPTAQWRAMFALARYGGLRCPSEVLSLRWIDIDWDRERITVTSPKTEHHEDGASREIPLWPELRPYLQQCFELAEVGAEFVITDYRKMDSSYGTLLTKKLKSAKITPWHKPWQNLRSTCETELVETFPIQVVCAWLGNSPAVAQKHYLQVTDELFAEAVQNPVQQMHETRSDDSQRVSVIDTNVNVLREFATTSGCLQTLPMGDEGLEPYAYFPRVTAPFENGGPLCGPVPMVTGVSEALTLNTLLAIPEALYTMRLLRHSPSETC